MRGFEKKIKFPEKLQKKKHPIEMLNHYGKTLSKEYILKNIWSYSSDADTHTVETHIYRLRQKIQDSFGDK